MPPPLAGAVSRLYGLPICCRCDRVIEGEAVLVPAFSASGARPDQHRHPDGECPPRREGGGRFVGRAYLPPVAP